MKSGVKFILGAVVPPCLLLAGHSGKRIDFEKQIQPIFKAHCAHCHGADAQNSGMRLDTAAGFQKGGMSGRPFVPGNSRASVIIQRLTGQGGLPQMPMGFTPLSADQIKLIKDWIDQGARFNAATGERHWAFVKPMRREPPAVKSRAWVRNPIDAFVLPKLEQKRLDPSPTADRTTLIRRVTLDLVGLPPTPEEVDAFLADRSPQAYEKVVDRLLASPRYGERQARIWLDLARYADSNGYEKDNLRSMWPYRDWVIKAFNDNMPYDRFVVEQISGDMIPNATLSQKIAGGFHRNTMYNEEGGVDPEEQRWLTVVDRVATTSQVFLGITMQCAQCHDHKYDPFTQKEYYRLFAYFDNAKEPELELPDASVEAARRDLRAQIAEAEKATLEPGLAPKVLSDRKNALQSLRDRLANTRGPITLVFEEKMGVENPSTYTRRKGSYLAKDELVRAGVPAALNPFPTGYPRNRLGFAYWLASADNPLTARVQVNRMWETYFGRGLVETSENFGSQGSPPTHPELLDWMATEFIRRGWDMKAMHRLIVTSATYRQTSRVTPKLTAVDPYNLLLTRAGRFRMEAEMVRDLSLSVAGLLSAKIGGPSVYPSQPDGIWDTPYNGVQWGNSQGEDRYRRGLYTFWRRSAPYPAFVAFDATSREFCTVRRVRTNTPLQALTTLNDPAFIDAARALAKRMMGAAGEDRSRLTYGFRLCVARAPAPAEAKRLLSLLETERKRYEQGQEAAKALAGDAEGAAWTVVANVLLNLDETLTKE